MISAPVVIALFPGDIPLQPVEGVMNPLPLLGAEVSVGPHAVDPSQDFMQFSPQSARLMVVK